MKKYILEPRAKVKLFPPEKLTSQTVLCRVPNLTVKIESDNQIRIFWQGKETWSNHRALLVLDLFARPYTLAEAFEHLQPMTRSVQDWIDLTSSIVQLYRQGVLLDELEPSLIRTSPGFDGAGLHIRMLNDRDRTSRFLDAIAATVLPGDIVLDLGTGTGVLAVAAVRAGARHVYAIEASNIAVAAVTTFEANAVSDRVTLIQGWSTQVTIPEPADVLVSEIIGDEPLGERVLEATLDARKRLLKPIAKLIPGRLRVHGLPVTIPQEKLSLSLFTHQATSRWESWYGIKFGPWVELSEKYPPYFSIEPRNISTWGSLCKPILLTEIDFNSFSSTTVETKVSSKVENSGTINGFAFFFELELSSGNWLSTNPESVSDDSSWRSLVQILPAPLEVIAGDELEIKYQYPADYEAPSVTIAPLKGSRLES